jgi:hypothetical protein
MCTVIRPMQLELARWYRGQKTPPAIGVYTPADSATHTTLAGQSAGLAAGLLFGESGWSGFGREAISYVKELASGSTALKQQPSHTHPDPRDASRLSRTCGASAHILFPSSSHICAVRTTCRLPLAACARLSLDAQRPRAPGHRQACCRAASWRS